MIRKRFFMTSNGSYDLALNCLIFSNNSFLGPYFNAGHGVAVNLNLFERRESVF
jgi:hypothetical protein